MKEEIKKAFIAYVREHEPVDVSNAMFWMVRKFQNHGAVIVVYWEMLDNKELNRTPNGQLSIPKKESKIKMTKEQYIEVAGRLVAAERQRQIDTEGYQPEHDRQHGHTQLALAAQAYYHHDASYWPWDGFYKPKGPLKNLIRAGALYQAAIDVAYAIRQEISTNIRQKDDYIIGRNKSIALIARLLEEADQINYEDWLND